VAGDKYHQAVANYYSRFVTEYEKQNIPIWGITVQNEPAGNTGTWQGTTFTPEDERDFLRLDLGPILRRDHPDLKIMMFDDQRSHLPDWVKPTLSDPASAQYVDGIAFHWYAR
jgi:glucosylceramidase